MPAIVPGRVALLEQGVTTASASAAVTLAAVAASGSAVATDTASGAVTMAVISPSGAVATYAVASGAVALAAVVAAGTGAPETDTPADPQAAAIRHAYDIDNRTTAVVSNARTYEFGD